MGTDYLWMFQKDRILRREPGEPVTIDTVLRWVISRPIGQWDLDEEDSARVNFVTGEMRALRGLNNQNKFWNLESIGS